MIIENLSPEQIRKYLLIVSITMVLITLLIYQYYYEKNQEKTILEETDNNGNKYKVVYSKCDYSFSGDYHLKKKFLNLFWFSIHDFPNKENAIYNLVILCNISITHEQLIELEYDFKNYYDISDKNWEDKKEKDMNNNYCCRNGRNYSQNRSSRINDIRGTHPFFNIHPYKIVGRSPKNRN